MKTSFQYSKSNKFFLGVVFTIWLVGIFVAPPKTSFGFGERFGSLMALWLFPTLFAWLFWLFSKRSLSVLSITFNIVLTLAVLGQLSSLSRRAKQTTALSELSKKKSALSEVLMDADSDPSQIDSARDDYYEDVGTTFDNLAKSSNGKEAKFYEIMGELSIENQSNDKRWGNSINAVMDESVLDFTTLDNLTEAERQKEIIRKYIFETKSYKAYFLAVPENLKSALSPLGDDFRMALGAIKGANNKIEMQRPVMIPLLDAHEAYGKVMVSIIDFLTEQKGKWNFTEGTLTFDDSASQETCDKMLEQLTNHEETINELADKLTI